MQTNISETTLMGKENSIRIKKLDMKLFFNVIILGALFIGCSSDTSTESKNTNITNTDSSNIEIEVTIRDNLAYKKFSNTPFSGRGIIKEDNHDSRIYKVDFLDGIPNGNFEKWSSSGALLEKKNFSKGVLSGKCIEWDETTGEIVSEKTYLNNEIVSGWSLYNYKGEMLSNLVWVDGKKNGIEKYNDNYPCDKDGKLKYSKFSDGKFIGCAKKTNLTKEECQKKIDKHLAANTFDEDYNYICIE
jgi:antitoxin component YwqK of YwqJK toxin-antitoxin module